MLTTVVGERRHGGEVTLGVLGDDAKAGQGALFTGDVEGCVSAVVGQQRVSAGLQESVHQVGLLCDHCQVEGGLCGTQQKHVNLTAKCAGFGSDSWIWHGYYLSLVVLHIEEGVMMRQFDHLDGMFGGFVNDGQMEQPVWGGQKKRGELK